ncbi:MAG: hypothetical protein EOP04_06590 [Proteobacteria bacterium]|nr:MAG: hypothetical protein EOP04_06590 [Pseudomonadota bacterium]
MNNSHKFFLLEKALITALGMTQIPTLSFAQESNDKRILRIEKALIKIKNDNDRIALKIADLNRQLGNANNPPLWDRVSAKTVAIQNVWSQLEQSAIQVEFEAKKKAFAVNIGDIRELRTMMDSTLLERGFYDLQVEDAIARCSVDTARTDLAGIPELEEYDAGLEEIAGRASGPESRDIEWN